MNSQSSNPKEFTIDYFLTAAECDAQKEISLPLLTQRFIDISTAHANRCGIGYDRLIADRNAWVLSRLTIEMKRFPAINESYSLTTWIESLNRHFSERNVEVRDSHGQIIGYARLIWVAINIDTRRPADLTPYMGTIPPSERPCPIERQSKLTAVANPDISTTYRFKYSDIDFNRHVNSTRYIQFILDLYDLCFFDHHFVRRFEIAYMAETRFNDVVEVKVQDNQEYQHIEISRDGAPCTRARIYFAPRTPQKTL